MSDQIAPKRLEKLRKLVVALGATSEEVLEAHAVAQEISSERETLEQAIRQLRAELDTTASTHSWATGTYELVVEAVMHSLVAELCNGLVEQGDDWLREDVSPEEFGEALCVYLHLLVLETCPERRRAT